MPQCDATTDEKLMMSLSGGATAVRGVVKRFCCVHKSDPVGTRCPASGLGFRLWTRGSASLPMIFFTAPGDFQKGLEFLRSEGH